MGNDFGTAVCEVDVDVDDELVFDRNVVVLTGDVNDEPEFELGRDTVVGTTICDAVVLIEDINGELEDPDVAAVVGDVDGKFEFDADRYNGVVLIGDVNDKLELDPDVVASVGAVCDMPVLIGDVNGELGSDPVIDASLSAVVASDDIFVEAVEVEEARESESGVEDGKLKEAAFRV